MVPSLAHDKRAGLNPLLSNGVPQNFAEAFKTVRTKFCSHRPRKACARWSITSAGPGEGKSLGREQPGDRAWPRPGQRVLLIDADMRRPRVHEIFGSDQEPGLSNVLSGNAKTSEAVQQSTVTGLWLMNAGHIPPNPAELLASRRYTD